MGKITVTEVQGVLETAPKPSRFRSWLATIYGVASALVVSVLMTGQAAARQYWVQDPYGDWELVTTGPEFPEPLLIALAVLAVCGIAFLLLSLEEPGQSSDTPTSCSNLPAEIANPQPVEYYSDQVARVRAYTRLLDAEAEHARRYIEANRLKAEAAEIARMLDDDQRREGW